MKTSKLPIKVCFVRFQIIFFLSEIYASKIYKNSHFKKLLNADEFPEMKEKFPKKEFNLLLSKYNRHFGFIRLRNEFIVLPSAPDVDICNRPIQLMLKYMTEKKLTLLCLLRHKFLIHILTIPARMATQNKYSLP